MIIAPPEENARRIEEDKIILAALSESPECSCSCPRCGAKVTTEISPGYHNCGFCHTYFDTNNIINVTERDDIG